MGSFDWLKNHAMVIYIVKVDEGYRLITELIRKRKQGKQAFIVMDRIIEYDINQNEP